MLTIGICEDLKTFSDINNYLGCALVIIIDITSGF